MNAELDQLLKSDGRIWRGKKTVADIPILATGFPELDRVLPGGGWPAHALTEIRVAEWGIGELSLLLPAMRALNDEGFWLVWVTPPFEPYPPALCQRGLDVQRMLVVDTADSEADFWWVMEKLLRHPAARLVLGWPRQIRGTLLRRLQLAAEEGGTIGMLFHREAIDSTPAPLRLALSPSVEGLEIRVLKARGGFGGAVARVVLN